MKKCPDSTEVLQERMRNAQKLRKYPSKEEQALDHIHIKINGKKKQKFQEVCKANKTNPSKMINYWIDEYIEEYESAKEVKENDKC